MSAAGGAAARLASLKQLVKGKPWVRGIECHSGISGLIAEKATGSNGEKFDFLWSSSLTASTTRARPDIEVVDTTARCQILEESMDVTSLPFVYDGDTGGLAEIFRFTCMKLQRMGVSAVVIEDKTGLKQNSLFGTDRAQLLADIDEFSEKLMAGQKAKVHEDFMIFSRLEALIAGAGEEEALKRAKAYVEKGGVDGIMIHSKEKKPDEILSFLHKFRNYNADIPIIVVPTTYNSLTEKDLADAGANIVIHANHLIRSAYPAMQATAESILSNGRSKEVEDANMVLSVKQIINLIDQVN